jgi:PAS domain S-box-containing protein
VSAGESPTGRRRTGPAHHTARPESASSTAAGPREPGTSDLFRLLVGSVREYAIFALDPQGHVLTWNPGAEQMKGWTEKEILGSHFSVFYQPEDIAAGRPGKGLRFAEERGSFEDEGWRLRKDGSRFWANVVITALRDDAGELVGFAKVTRDLTRQHEAEEQLRRSEERFRLLVQSVRDYAIFMLDPEGRVATWNEGAERIKGYSADEIVGRNFSIFYTADAVSAAYPQHELEVAAKEGRYEDEGWRVRKDGSLFWANVLITALFNAAGTLVGFAKVTRDLTERRQAQERALADARRLAEIEASNHAKTEFLSMLSHELRTPLNAIGGYADLLALEVAGGLNETQRQYLQRIRTGQQELLGLVNDLLSFTRLEAGGLEYNVGPVPVLQLLRDVEEMLRPQAVSKRLRFGITSCPEDAVVLADSARVQQILLNLLANAVKFTPAGGRVSMACSVPISRSASVFSTRARASRKASRNPSSIHSYSSDAR